MRLKSGDNKHVVVLTIQGFQDSVTVSRDKQEAASDRKTTLRDGADARADRRAFGRSRRDGAAAAGHGGERRRLRVDSFEGGRLPPKSQIKSIHITRDAFAAENHFAGGLFIDIITQPGVGPLRIGLNYAPA